MADFLPSASWPALRLRAQLLDTVRTFFKDQGFLEVETPLLSADTVIDRHLHPIAVTGGAAGTSRSMWLQTSPEFHMKRLVAAGAPPIFQITRAMRAGEQGPRHNLEFTIVEWYRAGDQMPAAMQLLSDLCRALLACQAADQISYREAFERHLEIDPHRATIKQLRGVAMQQGIPIPAGLADDDRDGWLDLLLVEQVRPHLGIDRPTIVYDYPASQAALARIRTGSVDVAERFELFVDGVELANGYHELLDAAELQERFQATNELRRADGRDALPVDSRLLEAMRHGLPPCSGCALGLDRVVMLAAGADSLEQVIAFPTDRA